MRQKWLSFLIVLIGINSNKLLAQDLSRQAQRPQQKAVPVNSSEANTWDKVEAWNFNFGSHTEFFNNVQIDTKGTQRKFEFGPTVGFGARFAISPTWKFLPEANWVLPLKQGNSNLIKNLFMFRADMGYELMDWLRLRAGTSIMWLNMHGKGGKTNINNGAGQSTFYNPDENRSALNNTFDLGAEFILSPDWSTRLQTYTYSLFKEERRQISYTLFVTYNWN